MLEQNKSSYHDSFGPESLTDIPLDLFHCFALFAHVGSELYPECILDSARTSKGRLEQRLDSRKYCTSDTT